MKKITICLLLAFALSKVSGQGIVFLQNKDWQETLHQAKFEHKLIFIDCYATWCVPCKKMDNDVYVNNEVGALVNRNFISVKLQLDTNRQDSQEIKLQYSWAKKLAKQFNVTAVPSYLFIDENGAIVHKSAGLMSVPQFLKVCQDALTPDMQYYSLLKTYRRNAITAPQVLQLLLLSRDIGDKSLADSLTKDFFNNYFFENLEDFRNNRNVVKLAYSNSTLFSINDLFFKKLLSYPSRFETVLGKGASEQLSQSIIKRSMIDDQLYKIGTPRKLKPDWQGLQTQIGRRFGKQTASAIILDAKLEWAEKHNLWEDVARYQIQITDNKGIDSTDVGMAFLNNMIFNVIFLHSNSPEHLRRGLGWMKFIIKRDSDVTYIDTYANLLYKLGKKAEAMHWENLAIAKEQKNAQGQNRKADTTYQINYDKMKKNLPTWF